MLSPQTRSFVVILFTAIFAMYAAIMVNSELNKTLQFAPQDGSIIQNPNLHNRKIYNTASAKEERQVNQDNWVDFKDPESNLHFKYPANWETTTISYQASNQDYRITVGPKQSDNPIAVYVSKKDYFAMDGLPATKTKINGTTAWNMDNLMVALKNNNKYFTFYAGPTWDYVPEFKAMINTIDFK